MCSNSKMSILVVELDVVDYIGTGWLLQINRYYQY